MGRSDCLLVACLFVGAMIPASSCFSQSLGLDKPVWNFGDVEVGNSTSTVFRLSSLESTPLQIFDISVVDAPSGSSRVNPSTPFSVDTFSYFPGATSPHTPGNYIPAYMLQDDYLEANVSFTPSSASLIPDVEWLRIHSNDQLEEYTFIQLSGRGVDATPVPEPTSLMLVGTGVVCFVSSRFKKGLQKG